jgi:nucleotide sugar dehydrogenase
MELSLIEERISSKKLVLAVFGLGRIGLPTAVEFAHHGYKVIGVDINKKLLEDLRKSNTFVDEPGLVELLQECNSKNMIDYIDNAEQAVEKSDFLVLCLPTPITEDRIPDFSIIEDVCKKIGKKLRPNQFVIVESSISPTTIRDLIVPILAKESGLKINEGFGVCSCPERADPGKIVDNFDKIPRIIGGSSEEVTNTVKKLYQNITKAQLFCVSNTGTANAIKLTENIFRDVNIALMNEFAVLYELLGIDIKEVIAGCSTKYNFQPHFPGPGVGGPCLPANPYYIIKDAEKVNYIPFLIRVAREINDRMPDHVKDLVVQALNFDKICVKEQKIAVLGLSYKADVRDVQISPSVKVAQRLAAMDATLQVFDPYYKGESVGSLSVMTTLEEALTEAVAVVVLTDHKEFKDLDFSKVEKLMARLVIVDSRNIYDPKKLPKGARYCGVGRPLQIIQ